MRRLVLGAAAALAFTPAAYGLIGNDSFAQDVPAQVPASAELFTPRADATATGTPAPTSPTPTSGRTSEVGDDHGGDRDRDDRTEPGDDRDSGGSGRDSSGHGSDDPPGSDD